jgi:hypothetical protein
VGGCHDNGFKPVTTACGDPSDTACDNPDHCSGNSGACLPNFEPAATNCGDAEGACTNQDKCDGAGGCTDNGFKPVTTACGSPLDTECDNPDHCSGNSGACLPNHEPATTNCGDAGTECTNQDKCDGAGGCHDNGFKPDDTGCTEDGNRCTNDACLAGTCAHPPKPSGTHCGSSSDTQCDNADTCDGSGNCQDNNEPNGTRCDEGDVCSSPDTCQSGACTPGPVVGGCKVTGGGQLTTGGDKVSFGFNAQTTGSGYKGQVEYQNHTKKTNYHSLSITSLVITPATSCPIDGKKATFGGQIRKKGDANNYSYTIVVEDCGEPGRDDTFYMSISDGESRGPQRLDKGNIQVH